ncbi:MAG: GatB/YqeY domain-containing protein [Bacilli bacterium]|nr:GatB/YqeY domain-containing protein [Bacilli bacterium]
MLVEKLQADIITAMKEHDKEKLTVLRMAKGTIDKEHIDKKVEINDELLIDCVSREIKQRNEAILEFEKGNREDLVEKNKKEIEILKEYLPKQLTEEEIEAKLDEIFAEVKPESIKDMGKVMQKASSLKGSVDMKELSNKIRERLNNI